MAAGALSIKLRCGSWQQLATIYRRDLSKGTMFLKASTPPAIGTEVKIDLTLPSDTVIVLTGIVDQHVTDPQRGSGVELKLAPIPTNSVWLIESALSTAAKVRPPSQTPSQGVPVVVGSQSSGPVRMISDGEDVALAERELISALGAEVESLKKLNPFLVLGVGYEAVDPDVRAAFGELTKRYHPDRFARYQSVDLRQIAAEIFILIRDAYRRIGDDTGRAQVLQSLGRAPAPRAVPGPRATTPPPSPPPFKRATTNIALDTPQQPVANPARAIPPQQPARPPVTTPKADGSGGMPTPPRTPPPAAAPERPPMSSMQTERRPVLQPLPPIVGESIDTAHLDDLLDGGKFDEALGAFKILAKRAPQDRTFRAGIELCEGLKAMAARDRLEAAQRFEAALEIDPSNERAARELADMRRQATNERKGLLSRLMGKKE